MWALWFCQFGSQMKYKFLHCVAILQAYLTLCVQDIVSKSYRVSFPVRCLRSGMSIKVIDGFADGERIPTNDKRYYCYIIYTNNRTYAGYTVNLKRRLRQHNREIQGGARSTSMFTNWQYLSIMTSSSWDTVSHAMQVEYLHKHPTRKMRCGKFRGPKGRIRSLVEICNQLSKMESIQSDALHLGDAVKGGSQNGLTKESAINLENSDDDYDDAEVNKVGLSSESMSRPLVTPNPVIAVPLLPCGPPRVDLYVQEEYLERCRTDLAIYSFVTVWPMRQLCPPCT
jgi:predicted GIY-YIG superfamily endonuclease